MSPSTRDRPAKSPLSRDAVITAGLKVLREEGIEGVTMRRVASELDTGAASLYVYVSNRQDLLNQMFDAVTAEVDLGDEPDPQRWREQLVAVLTSARDAMDRYPGIARVPLANVPTGPNASRAADRMLGLLRAGGVDDRSAAWFLDVVSLYLNAASFETSIYVEQGREHDEVDEQIREGFEQLDLDELPNIRSMMPLLLSGDGDERFAFGLQLMIDGLLNTEPPKI
ncbi:MAG: TetR/AcrR family transcriptional regulator [Actinobacteria bacterium]|nr:MAG: TetR/AcrR family transcriptional regulator [Actinomycetota bacterium]